MQNTLRLNSTKFVRTNMSATGGRQVSPHQVYVGGVAWAATNEDIRKHFADCGTVVSVKIPIDRESGRSRGFAFVAFDDAGGVEEALKLAGSELMGRMIRVNLCHEPNRTGNRE